MKPTKKVVIGIKERINKINLVLRFVYTFEILKEIILSQNDENNVDGKKSVTESSSVYQNMHLDTIQGYLSRPEDIMLL